MRKRIVIAVLAVVAIISVALFLKPREPSIGDHVNGYRAALTRLQGTATFWERIGDAWHIMWGRDRRFDKLAKHQEALIRLGYLQEQTFVVSNRPLAYVSSNVFQHVVVTGETNMLDFTPIFTHDGTNSIRMLTRKEDIPKWEALIRKADVPESGQ